MTEKPIIFSTPMVQAIQRGDKTMTRRACKVQPQERLRPSGKVDPAVLFHEGHWYACDHKDTSYHDTPYNLMKLRYQVGDLLWVRETWLDDRLPGSDIPAFHYKADGTVITRSFGGSGKWKSPIFMPRWASRITLEVTAVKVERLQDISEDDCYAEGYEFIPWGEQPEPDAHGWFRWFWEAINGTGSWDLNPWVEAYTFRVVPR